MRIRNIIVLILVLLMLFLNVTSVFANEEIQNNTDIIETGDQNINYTSADNLIEVDISNFNGYIKPSTNEYKKGDRIFQDDEFASYYFYNLKETLDIIHMDLVDMWQQQ